MGNRHLGSLSDVLDLAAVVEDRVRVAVFTEFRTGGKPPFVGVAVSGQCLNVCPRHDLHALKQRQEFGPLPSRDLAEVRRHSNPVDWRLRLGLSLSSNGSASQLNCGRSRPWSAFAHGDTYPTTITRQHIHTSGDRGFYWTCLGGSDPPSLAWRRLAAGRSKKPGLRLAWEKPGTHFSSRLAVASLVACVLFASCLASVAPNAKRLAIGNVVPLATIADRHDVVGLGWGTGGAAYHATVSALPGIACQHSQTPCSMSLVCVSPGVGVRPHGFVSPVRTAKAGGAMQWDACWHV